MKKNIYLLLISVLSISIFSSCVKGNKNSDTKKITLTLSTPDPDSSSITDAAREFAKQIFEKSNGEIEIKVYPNGSLYGGDPAAGVKQLSAGGLDMLTLTASLYASFNPEFTILSIPYLFKDTEQYKEYLNSTYGQNLLKSLDELGINGLSFWSRSFRKITTSVRPINSPEDLKGIKFRVLNNPLWVEYFQATGAITTPMAFGELYSALQLKTVDAQENPIDIPLSSKFYEVQKYLSHTDHITDAWIIGIGKEKMAELSLEHQEILLSVAEQIQDWKFSYDEEADKKAEEKLIEEGMIINTVSSENKAKFAQISKDLYPRFRELVQNNKLFDETVKMLQ